MGIPPRERAGAAVSDLETLLEPMLRKLARMVADELRAGSDPDMLDQHTSGLGPRRHVAAIRSGKLAGVQVGRRWLVRKEDLATYLAGLNKAPKKTKRSAEAELADELGIRLEH